MRSLAKPLQTSIVFDTNIIKEYNLNKKELAIFSGSHSGTDKHIEILKAALRKTKLKENVLSLKPIQPLDLRKFKGKCSKLHNNCSGKHTMMAIMCKYLKFDSNYTNENHPLQKLIKEKQEELSGFKSDYLTYDGCSTPLWGLPYENIIQAYFNLIHNDKYKLLFNSILNYPQIYGGYNRFDSEIIKLSNKKLFSKVGAGGFVIVYNFKSDEILLVKMAQDNNETRRIITLSILNKLNWLNYPIDEYIYNQKKQIVAKYYNNIDL